MRVKLSQDVVARDLSGEAILLDLATSTYFGLDEVGARIWQLLGVYDSTEAIVPLLMQEYEVEEGQLKSDLDALVRQLLAKKLLVAADDPD